MDLAAVFEKFMADDEYIEFDRIEQPLHPRPDLCAFLLLHQLVPDTGDMVVAAEHDVIYLDTSPDALAAVATEADILTLVRCGVFYDTSNDSLTMFV